MLALSLALGLVTHSVAGTGSTQSAMMTPAGDVSKSDPCDDCGDHQKGMFAACAAYCSGTVTAPLALVVSELIAVDILQPAIEGTTRGRSIPPDPYPPRPTYMS